MSQPLEAKPAQAYAEHAKTLISTVADAAELVSNMQVFDESPANQNARILQSLKQAVQTLAFSADELTIIEQAVVSLGARFELDMP